MRGAIWPACDTAVYGGQAVPRPFLDRMLQMAPRIATGLGLTEASGFCTYTPFTADAGEVARGMGWAMPAYPLSIREAMDAHGRGRRGGGGGQVGHICFRGPQNFLGYVNDPEATAATLSQRRLALHRRPGLAWTNTGCISPAAPSGC